MQRSLNRLSTDIILLNEAREISEALLDDLKPRTYRLKARRAYLNLVKNKRPRFKLGVEQLQFGRRNLGHISVLLDYLGYPPFPLNHSNQRQYWIIQHVFDHQTEIQKKTLSFFRRATNWSMN